MGSSIQGYIRGSQRNKKIENEVVKNDDKNNKNRIIFHLYPIFYNKKNKKIILKVPERLAILRRNI